MSQVAIAEYAIIVLVHMVKNKRAFTLIELIISVSIIALFTSMFLASYNKQTAYKKLDQDTNKLIDVLELAKKKAKAGDVGNRTDCNFNGYLINFSGQNYYLSLICKDSSGVDQYFGINSYHLTDTVNFYPLTPSPSSIRFSPLTGSNNSFQVIQLLESTIGPLKGVTTIGIMYGNISKS